MISPQVREYKSANYSLILCFIK